MPQISVIVPVYKVEPYLSRCVDSILGQTFTDFELILVDDGSPDNCPALCDTYAAQDSRVHVIHQKNGGLSAARNAGIDWSFANSDSEWLTFVDSDDWIHPKMLRALLTGCVQHHTSVGVCGYIETDGTAADTISPSQSKTIQPENFFVSHIVNATVAWGKLYKKSLWDILRYPVGKIHEDEFITYQILFSQKQISVISAPLYNYYINPNGITKSTWSPRHLDSLEAKEQQLAFLSQTEFFDAYQHCIVLLLWNIISQIQKIDQDISSPYQSEKKRLYRLLRKKIKQYRKFLTFEKNRGIYEKAYPKLMNLYWTIQGILHKLHLKR